MLYSLSARRVLSEENAGGLQAAWRRGTALGFFLVWTARLGKRANTHRLCVSTAQSTASCR